MVNMWMVRAGENAFLIDDFKELSLIGIGWKVDDLTGKTIMKDSMIKLFWEDDEGNSSLADNDDYEKYGLKTIQLKKFRVLGEIACGQPIYANEEYETYIEASCDIKADFCLIARGDSMINARIFDGDVVFIRNQPDVENGEIAAVIIDDEATLKRVFKHENRVELRPENPMHKSLNYEGEELNHIRILGKAVAFQSCIR